MDFGARIITGLPHPSHPVSLHDELTTICAFYHNIPRNTYPTQRYDKSGQIIERDPDEPVTAQMFRALRRRLRVILDGRRRGVREAPPPQPRPPAQVRARQRTTVSRCERPTTRLTRDFTVICAFVHMHMY